MYWGKRNAPTVLPAPLGSFLANRLTCRVTVVLGGLLSSTGLVLSSFATSLEHLYISMGFLSGLSISVMIPHSVNVERARGNTTMAADGIRVKLQEIDVSLHPVTLQVSALPCATLQPSQWLENTSVRGRPWRMASPSPVLQSLQNFIPTFLFSLFPLFLCQSSATPVLSELHVPAYQVSISPFSGSGIGTFILAPAVQLLIERYSWRGAMLVLGAFVSNLCVCGALMRPRRPRRSAK